jgi:hypothetical protein
MNLSLLAPLFLAGLVALGVPVLVHLTNKDRKDVVRFPSLRFLTRLPYRQMRRQRIQHWMLFALRALAIVLLVAAFSRPLVDGMLAGPGTEAPGRELIVVLDRSYSMGYGQTWERALDAVRATVAGEGPASRMSLITFDEQATLIVDPTSDGSALVRALDTLGPGARATRLPAAIQRANQVLAESPLGQREVVVISDFQAAAWDRTTPTALHPGATLRPVDVSADRPSNRLVTSVDITRTEQEGRQAMTVAARVVNQGSEPVAELPVILEVNGQEAFRTNVSLPPSESQTVRLGPVAQPATMSRATVRLGDDLLAPDNAFHVAVTSRPAVSVLIIEGRNARGNASLYLREALRLAEDPAFAVDRRRVDRVRPVDILAAEVVLLHDSPFPPGAAGTALVNHVGEGAGLWVVLGAGSPLSSWPEAARELLPGTWRGVVDRVDRQGVRLANVDYRHPAFEIFRGADDGNVAGPRFFRYRAVDVADSSETVARYTDGAPALVARRYHRGRVLLWGSPFDNSWSDLPVQPVFLPFVHRVTQFLGGERTTDGWRLAGQAVDLEDVLADMDIDIDTLRQEVIVEAPGRERRPVDVTGASPIIALTEAGFYEVYPLGRERASYPVAVNVDRRESDLRGLDVAAFVAATTLPDTGALASAGQTATLTPAERERRQGLWWYLLLGAIGLLTVESLWSNRPGQEHPAPATWRRAGIE